MKKIGIILAFLLAFVCVTGCQSAKTIETTSSPLPEKDAPSVSEKPFYTIDQITYYFNNDVDHKNFIVTDCVVVDDSAYGLIGVVQYTDENNNPCNLGFVKEERWSYPAGLAADGGCTIADDSKLTYLGDGKVALSLIEIETGKNLDFVVEYSSENGNTNFGLTSNERK